MHFYILVPHSRETSPGRNLETAESNREGRPRSRGEVKAGGESRLSALRVDVQLRIS